MPTPQTAYYVVNLPEIARVDGTPFLRATALVPAAGERHDRRGGARVCAPY